MARTVLQSTIYQIRARVDPSRQLNIGATTKLKVDYELRIGFSDEYLNWMYNPPDRDGGYTVGDVINFLEDKGIDVLYPIRRRKNAVARFVQRQILETVVWHRVYSNIGGRRRYIGKEFKSWNATKRLVFDKRYSEMRDVSVNGKIVQRPVEYMSKEKGVYYEVPTISAKSVYNILNKLGKDMVEQIKDELIGSIAPQLAESTIKRRVYKHKAHPEYYEYLAGIDQGLVETGHLMQSVTYEIIDHSSEGKELTYENIGGSRFRHVASGREVGRPKGSGDIAQRVRGKSSRTVQNLLEATGTVVRGTFKGTIDWGDLKKMPFVDFLQKYPGTRLKAKSQKKAKEKTYESKTLKTRKATEEEMEQFRRDVARNNLVVADKVAIREAEQVEKEQIGAFKEFSIKQWEKELPAWQKKHPNNVVTDVIRWGVFSNHRQMIDAIHNRETPTYIRHAYEEFLQEYNFSI